MCYEGKGAFAEVANQLSPWQNLMRHIDDEGVTITSLSLFTDAGQTFNLPAAGRNPKFRIFEAGEVPIDYNAFHALAHEAGRNKTTGEMERSTDFFAVAEAIYSDRRLQVWVDERNPRNCWSVIVPSR